MLFKIRSSGIKDSGKQVKEGFKGCQRHTCTLQQAAPLCPHASFCRGHTKEMFHGISQQTLPGLCIKYLPTATGSKSLIPRDP